MRHQFPDGPAYSLNLKLDANHTLIQDSIGSLTGTQPSSISYGGLEFGVGTTYKLSDEISVSLNFFYNHILSLNYDDQHLPQGGKVPEKRTESGIRASRGSGSEQRMALHLEIRPTSRLRLYSGLGLQSAKLNADSTVTTDTIDSTDHNESNREISIRAWSLEFGLSLLFPVHASASKKNTSSPRL